MAYLSGQGLEQLAAGLDGRGPRMDGAAFRAAMREFASGVAIVATGRGAARKGCTATSVCSLSLDPPALIVCLDRASATFGALKANGVFGLSVLAADQAGLASRFAGCDGVAGASRFDLGDWITFVTGAPLLAGAAAHIDCYVEEAIERHTHAIVIGRVALACAGDVRPLVHWRGKSLPLVAGEAGA